MGLCRLSSTILPKMTVTAARTGQNNRLNERIDTASAHSFYILLHLFSVPCKTTPNDRIIGFFGEGEHATVNFPFSTQIRTPSLRIQLTKECELFFFAFAVVVA